MIGGEREAAAICEKSALQLLRSRSSENGENGMSDQLGDKVCLDNWNGEMLKTAAQNFEGWSF